MLALLGITGLWLWKRPRWLFWAGWIVVPLLPRLIQLFSTRWTGTVVAERYLLQSLVPWCAMIVLVSNSALKRLPTPKLRGRLGAILLISACVVGGSLTHRHGRVFASDETLFNYALRHAPDDPVVLNSLAQLHMVKDENAEALPLLRRAIESEPGLVPAHLNLGIVLSRMGRTDEAIPSFEAALRLDRAVAGANLLLGDSLRDVGKIDEAARHYHAELRLQPRSVAARTNLGSYRYVKGDLTGALRYWEDALADAPENPDLLFNLGMVCRELSEPDRSAKFLRRFLTVADERYRAQQEMATRWLAE